MKTISKTIGLSTVLLALLFAGCASAPQAKLRYFWPTPPEQPRIEWLGAYQGANDLKEKSTFSFIVGEEDGETLRNPAGIASDGEGRVFVGDSSQRAVFVFNLKRKELHVLGGIAEENIFKNPSGIDFDADGNIYVGDIDKVTITVFDKSEKLLRSIKLSASCKSVGFFAIDKERKRIIIPDIRDHKVVIVDYEGKLVKSIETFLDGQDGFSYPTSVAVDAKGNIVVADSMRGRLVRFTQEGEFLNIIGKLGDNAGNINMVKGVALDSEGHIYITDVKSNRMQIFNEKGEALIMVGMQTNNQSIVGGFNAPTGLYIDKNDTIYITEKLSRRFQIFQYLNSRYMAENPILDLNTVAKPWAGAGKVKEDVKGNKSPVTPGK